MQINNLINSVKRNISSSQRIKVISKNSIKFIIIAGISTFSILTIYFLLNWYWIFKEIDVNYFQYIYALYFNPYNKFEASIALVIFNIFGIIFAYLFINKKIDIKILLKFLPLPIYFIN